ncbi:uncharacterized protein LOC123498781 [Portunus trituberculatus]|uniref:uncharacterized protein LOC123498781 n=1 Tax=Portunus trituberculatus TaxID=210409 RepID=UPI001E1CD111|nr:uncharacterized protein LOC123498781 [Portunus trituberculatus]
MRVYHNVSATHDTGTAFLCRLVCTHAHVDLCDVTRLPVLGLWRGLNKRPEEFVKFRNVLFSQPTKLNRFYDQHLLANFLWPLIKNDTLQHDSYTCTLPTHQGSIPFPTRREGTFSAVVDLT